MLRLGIRLHDMKAGTLKERAGYAREQGFSCVHLALGKTVQGFKMTPETFTSGLSREIKKSFEGEGVDIAVLGCYKNLAHPDINEVRKLQKLYEAHLRMAVILGCSVV
ncbi:MAG: sugar phosphate isomerase/epimerase, partial [Selenomonadaceae bacterium]|nr:sugar phosphate isomerase/epimerase [Selenomonadaceae bacterium]